MIAEIKFCMTQAGTSQCSIAQVLFGNNAMGLPIDDSRRNSERLSDLRIPGIARVSEADGRSAGPEEEMRARPGPGKVYRMRLGALQCWRVAWEWPGNVRLEGT